MRYSFAFETIIAQIGIKRDINKEEKKTPTCCCGKSVEGICCVKVLGAGCKSCHALYEAAKEAVRNLDLNIEVEYIKDIDKIMEHSVMRMPALVVNEKVVSMGKVLKAAEVERLLKG